MSITLTDADVEAIDGRLLEAVNALLVLRVMLGVPGPLPLPREALRAALDADDRYHEVEHELHLALDELHGRLPDTPTSVDTLVELEEMMHELAVLAAGAGWQLGRGPRG